MLDLIPKTVQPLMGLSQTTATATWTRAIGKLLVQLSAERDTASKTVFRKGGSSSSSCPSVCCLRN